MQEYLEDKTTNWNSTGFYNDPEILIFDESTNSLDIETERKILSEIQKFKKEKTIIIISHNNEILKNCDKILNI